LFSKRERRRIKGVILVEGYQKNVYLCGEIRGRD
jgi:hypothetical protein